MNYLFTADLHLGHANIIKPEYCNRPFANVQEMDDALVSNWNSMVKYSDFVYISGDVSFHHDIEHTIRLLKTMCGKKFLIAGNHDKKNLKDSRFRDQFVWIKDLAEIKIGSQGIVLCHYAMKVWNKSHHGYWQLYGHSHGNMPDDPHSLSMDVGVDTNNYRPYSFEEIKERMSKKTPKAIDHHRANL